MASLGTIRGQMLLDVNQALASFTAVRLAHLNTVTALATGSGALITAGAGFAAFGAVIAAGFVSAANATADFERELSFFKAVSGSTEEQLAAVREEALLLGQQSRYSAGEIAESFVELGKAGVDAQSIIDGIGEAVANLGAAGDLPLDSAAQIIMSSVSTFGLAATDAVDIADLLAGAANASILEVGDLGHSLKYAGGVASSVGMDINEVVTALALLGNYGIRGTQAGTSLRQMLTSLSGRSGPAIAAMEELGIITEDGSNKFFDAEGSAKSMAEIFQILQDATADLTEEQRLNAIRAIFQNRALAAAIALTDSGAEGFATMAEAIGQTTAMDVANERLNNLAGDVVILKSNLETLAITIGGHLQEALRGITQAITDVVQWFLGLDESTQKTILTIIAVIGAISLIFGAFLIFAGAILGAINTMIRLRDALGIVRAAIGAVRIAALGFFKVLLANPITWIVLAVIALVAAFIWLWNNVEGFRNFFIAVWEAIKVAAEAVVSWFQGLPAQLGAIWDSITSWATNTWNSFLSFMASIPGRIRGFFSSIGAWFSNLWSTITGFVVNAFTNALDFIGSIPGRIIAFFQAIPYAIGYIIGYMAAIVVNAFLALWEWFTVTLPQIIESVLMWFALLPVRITEFFTQIWENVVQWLTQTWISAVLLVTQLYNDIVNWIAQLPGRVLAFFTDVYNNAVTWLTNMATQAAILAADIYNGIVDWIKQLPARALEFFLDVYNNIRDGLSDALDAAVELAQGIYDGIIDWLARLPGAVLDIIGNVIDAFKDMVGAAFNAVADFGRGLWDGFKAGLGISSPSYIEYAIWAITDTVAEETDRLKAQVRTVQGWGDRLNAVSAVPTFDIQGNLANAAAQMANEVAKARKIQSEMASMTMEHEASRSAMSRLPNDAWETAYDTSGRSARRERNITVTAPEAKFPDRVQLVDENGDILAVTRVQTRGLMNDTERRKNLVGRVRR